MSQAAVHRPPAGFDASVVPGAKAAPFPGFVEPCHPDLREEAPSGGRWFTRSSSMATARRRTCEADDLPSTLVRARTGHCAFSRSPMRFGPCRRKT
jgi:hypothetical protein